MIEVDVEKLLPQKKPFVMVDCLYAYTEDSVKAGFTIKETDIFTVSGSFLEAGLVEHMAQCVALHTGYQFFLKDETPPTGYIGSISGINVEELPAIGDHIVTRVEILQEFLGITLVSAVCELNDRIIASGKMKTVLANA